LREGDGYFFSVTDGAPWHCAFGKASRVLIAESDTGAASLRDVVRLGVRQRRHLESALHRLYSFLFLHAYMNAAFDFFL
jgi:hypothetical protein